MLLIGKSKKCYTSKKLLFIKGQNLATGFFALFDDIAILMDDVAVMSKVATKKTAGILGDDLAVSANKAAGFTSSRELPVLWAITKGSFLNKIIILPVVFLMSAFMPWLIIPILMLGGVYLAYEGAEKIYEFFFHQEEKKHIISMEEKSTEQILDDEKVKVKSAIFTDFILSIEIIIIALSTVTDKPLGIQIPVVTFIAILATVGVYGIVALIVRMDDLGYKLIAMGKSANHILTKFGQFLVAALPKIIQSLTVIGTLAMLLVAGEIYLHNVHVLHERLHDLPEIISALGLGLIVGIITLFFVKIFIKIKSAF
ncbi:MAG: Membrane protein, putative [uncultured Sulfurovum sp.]|uniref:Membrane protein, putative n=1 Tax=uncultured Sulfurovum sp. TaxID=269237 RepID=A0A6S6SRB8_9BACT|nr:MAG: Membrane protein, putative [uncultured Sulfurovum sp.]